MAKKKFDLNNHVDQYEWNFDKKLIPINDDFGDKLKIDSVEGKKLKSYIDKDDDGYRLVVLEVNSWRGSIGAVHYYGKIDVSRSIHFTNIEDKKNRCSVSGYPLKSVDKKYTDFDIELFRPVDNKDIANDKIWGREKYLKVKIGQLTRGFWTEDDVIEIGKKVFDAVFKGKWKLEIRSYTGDKDEIYFLSN